MNKIKDLENWGFRFPEEREPVSVGRNVGMWRAVVSNHRMDTHMADTDFYDVSQAREYFIS